uniref:Uncharacterized protein n=1 Tax=Tetranychus urticae TaxID=32264 RepID=T1KE22_TETUR
MSTIPRTNVATNYLLNDAHGDPVVNTNEMNLDWMGITRAATFKHAVIQSERPEVITLSMESKGCQQTAGN